MRQIEFSQDDIKQLSYESIHQSHVQVRRRMQALLFKAQGRSHQEIGQYLDISQKTLRKYLDLYLNGGLEALKQLHYRGKTNHLLQHKQIIVEAMEAQPPASLKQAQAIIKEATGLQRSLPQGYPAQPFWAMAGLPLSLIFRAWLTRLCRPRNRRAYEPGSSATLAQSF